MVAPAHAGSGPDAGERSPSGASRRAPLVAQLLLATVACAALSVLLTGALLTRQYRPESPWSSPVDPTPSAALRRSLELVRWHELGLWVLLVSSLLAVVGVLVAASRRDVPRRLAWVPVAGAVVASAGALLAVVAWPQVQWEQLALEVVTVDSGGEGLWVAAFGDGILFVLVDGSEVSQAWMAAWLAVHLGGPVLAAAGGLVGAAATVRALRSPTG